MIKYIISLFKKLFGSKEESVLDLPLGKMFNFMAENMDEIKERIVDNIDDFIFRNKNEFKVVEKLYLYNNQFVGLDFKQTISKREYNLDEEQYSNLCINKDKIEFSGFHYDDIMSPLFLVTRYNKSTTKKYGDSFKIRIETLEIDDSIYLPMLVAIIYKYATDYRKNISYNEIYDYFMGPNPTQKQN